MIFIKHRFFIALAASGVLCGMSLAVSAPAERVSGMMFVRGGEYMMGTVFRENGYFSKPAHRVRVGSFYIASHELTFAEYDAFCDATRRPKPRDWGWGRGKRPVIDVSWMDAIAYCNWRSLKEGLVPCYRGNATRMWCNFRANGYRLPTDAEWEYAARERGRRVRFGNGKNIARASEINFQPRSKFPHPYFEPGVYRRKTLPVGSFAPNRLGLYDMSGNAAEWVWDWYDQDYYRNSPVDNPRGPAAGRHRVYRASSWGSPPKHATAFSRYMATVWTKTPVIGFRLARSR